jgi:hypothetical protein
MQFVDKEYIKTVSRQERRKHLKLNEPCIERGGASWEFRGLLAAHLGTTIPARGEKVCLCHACHNGKCSNPSHLYWGSDKDNSQDLTESGKYKNPTFYMRLKGGDEYVKEVTKRAAKASVEARSKLSFEERSNSAKLGALNRKKNGRHLHSEETKKLLSEKKRGKYIGEKHPTFGTIVINDGVINKRHFKNQPIPKGWYKGMIKKSVL